MLRTLSRISRYSCAFSKLDVLLKSNLAWQLQWDRLGIKPYCTTTKPEDRIGARKENYTDKVNPSDHFYEENALEESGKTVVRFINEEKHLLMINSFSNIGFKLNSGIEVLGPIAIFPKSLLHWNVSGIQDVNEESLSLFTALNPKLDVFILGVGEKENLKVINHKIYMYMKSLRINMEILPTEQALATFNFLNSERRYVAAALLPPTYISDGTIEDYIVDVDRVPEMVGPPPKDFEITPEGVEQGKENLKELGKNVYREITKNRRKKGPDDDVF